jgi:hypothetical protein
MYANSGAFSPEYPENYLEMPLILYTNYDQISPFRLKSMTYFINKQTFAYQMHGQQVCIYTYI